MKKIIILAIIAIASLGNTHFVNAKDDEGKSKSNNTVSVYVTEKVPGAKCNKDDKKSTEELTIYKCDVEKGTEQVVKSLGNIIKYFTYIASLFGVLFIVGNGIMYSMGGADQSLKDESKKRIIGTLLGLIVLLLSGPILQIIAPWIYK